MKDLFVRIHLGLGDALVCNGLIRTLAETRNVIIPAKRHNYESVYAMFMDSRNINVMALPPVDPDGYADLIANHSKDYNVLKLGFGNPQFDREIWDQEFYRQADVPFENCWSKFHVERDKAQNRPPQEYAFIHEDFSRGYTLNPRYLPKMPHVHADPGIASNIFEWCEVMENATELHLMESCFAILADHLPNLKARRVVIHDYCRKSIAPTYKRDFERIK